LRERWRIDFDNGNFPRGISNVVAKGNSLILYNADEVISIDPIDGIERWRHSPNGGVQSVKIFANDKVFVYFSEGDFLGVRFFDN